MSKAMQLVGIILLGVFTLVIINLMNDARSTDELDYYLLQEVTEASMYDAVDYSYYRESGQLKVDRDMFLESFNRRFAQSVANNRSYDIKIVDFNETPPKASIEVTAATIATVKSEVALITNRVNGIIETIYDNYVYSRGLYSNIVDDVPPVIIVDSQNNKVTFKDEDSYLQKYAIIKASEFNTSSPLGSVKKWTEIHDNVKKYMKEFTTEVKISSENLYAIVVDAAGNYSYKSLFDSRPGSSGYFANNNNFIIKLWDDNGLADEFTLVKMNYAGSKWSIDSKTQTMHKTGKVSKCTEGFCATKELESIKGCYITLATDDKGQQEIKDVSKLSAGINGGIFCNIGIKNVSVDSNNPNKINLTYEGDRQYFIGFIVDKNKELPFDTPNDKFRGLGDDKTLNSPITINEDGYYLHVKTAAGILNAQLIPNKTVTPQDQDIILANDEFKMTTTEANVSFGENNISNNKVIADSKLFTPKAGDKLELSVGDVRIDYGLNGNLGTCHSWTTGISKFGVQALVVSSNGDALEHIDVLVKAYNPGDSGNEGGQHCSANFANDITKGAGCSLINTPNKTIDLSKYAGQQIKIQYIFVIDGISCSNNNNTITFSSAAAGLKATLHTAN